MQDIASLRPITVMVCALGGEGGGVLAEWLIDTAIAAGYPAQSTSVPGVAQRTGATSYYIEVFPVPAAQLQGRRPVFALTPVPGDIDVLVSSELLETARQVSNGFSSPARTVLITSSSRALTTAERMQPGDGRFSNEKLVELVRETSREHYVFDMAQTAQQAGTVISAVLFGAIAASGAVDAVIARLTMDLVAGAAVAGCVRGHVDAARRQGAMVQQLLQLDEAAVQIERLPAEVAAAFPVAVHDMLAPGYARMVDYQNKAYADLYITRLSRVLSAERQADPAGAHGYATTRETARFLALWMAFDDVVRVADLKSRQTRSRRVLDEVRAGPDDLVRVFDHFKPGVPEFAGLLPQPIARRLLSWDQRRQRRGRPAWAMPLKVGSHTVTGMAMLRLMAGMKRVRHFGSRYAREQEMIEKWVGAVERAAAVHWRLGNELAQCGRLIKGYGETNERGKENLLHILDHLAVAATFDNDDQRAQAIADARTAALSDAAGKALDATLTRHGAPARPMKETPVRWVRRSPQPAKPVAPAAQES